METIKKRKKNSKKLPPVVKTRPRPLILNDYSEDQEDAISPNLGQKFPTLGANQDGWRQVSREKTVHSAIGINNASTSVTTHKPSSSALGNDKTRVNFNNNDDDDDDEQVDEMDTHHVQGFDHPQCDDPNLSDMEINDGHFKTVQGRLVGRRGPYKGMELDKLTDGRKNKLIVFIPPGKYFRAIGEHSERLSSWFGYCARICGPPIVPWHEIEKKYKSRLWAIVQDYFDVSIDSPMKWKKLEESGKVELDTPEMKRAKFEYFCFFQMKKAYGRWKHKLHNVIYRMYNDDDERLKNVPAELSLDAWKGAIKVFGSKEFQERSSINSTNRAAQTMVTSTGPIPFAKVEYDMMDEELGELPKALDVWKATHGISDDQGQIAFRDS